MNTQKGFISIAILLAIILGVIVVGGGAPTNNNPQKTSAMIDLNSTAPNPSYPALAGTVSGTNRICIVLSKSNLSQTYSTVVNAQWNVCSDNDPTQVTVAQGNWAFQSYDPKSYPTIGSLPSLENGAYNVGVYDENTGNLLASTPAVYWGYQVVSSADASSFHSVTGSNGLFYADKTHVWYGAGRGVLVLIQGADAKTFTVVAQSPSLVATDGTGHYYSFDAKGNLMIGTSYPGRG